MSELKFKGTLTHIGETNRVSEKFSKREFVINDNGMYPQEVQFELTQDNCSILDSYKVGDEIEVHFNLRGRAWTNKEGVTKYFNTLQAWKIENDSASYKPSTKPVDSLSEDTDLPF